MRKIVTPIRVAIALLAVATVIVMLRPARPRASLVRGCASDSPGALHVLFIGNSHTFVNDLPHMFCGFGSPERPIASDAVVAPGISLRRQWEDGKALRAIREGGRWDVIVLQEQSGVPLADPAEFEDSVTSFVAAIRAVGAKPALYELWPRRDIRQDPDALHRVYAAVAERAGAVLVPVGPVWNAASQRHPEVPLYQDDGLHARPSGTYLAACIFYAALLGRSPEHLPVSADLDGETALELQRFVWASVGPAHSIAR